MTQPLDSNLDALRRWYAEHARPYLAAEVPDRLPPLDAAFDRLIPQAVPELPICFLGAAGVGKSTLLNALVGGHLTVVPQGGVGPLTAQATLVRYGREPRFRATYLPRTNLHRMLFALERSYEAEMRRAGAAPDWSPGDDAELGEEDRAEVELATSGDRTPGEAAHPDKGEGYRRQACLMVLGTQYPNPEPDPRYLIDALRACLGRSTRWGFAPSPEDTARLVRVRDAIARSHEGAYDVTAGADLRPFLDELGVHASGSLAPMIRTLEVWWDADVLRDGLVLVDLPGVGVANDEYRRVTTEWIRRARAVVLVVDRAGVTESSAELLRSTGFLTSLLHEADEPDAEVPTLVVAAVKLDLSATDARDADRERQAERSRRWIQHFDDICAGMSRVIQGQVRTELEKIAEDGPEPTRDARRAVIDRVLANLQIHLLTPYEYRMLLRGDDEERPKIKHADESRVPAFLAALAQIGAARAARLRARDADAHNAARSRAHAAIEVVLEQWRAGERAAAESARLREELIRFAEPLNDQMLIRHGQFRGLLRDGMPREIELHAKAAALVAMEGMRRHLRKYEQYPWATLRAAVRRNGAFDGAREIDLPNELTLRFEEPLAVAWSKHILVALRQATRALADDHAALVGQIVGWARAQGGRVQPAVVEALHQELRAQADEVGEVGKEAIAELKQRVKSGMFPTVEAEVRRQCLEFVRSERDRGKGVHDRMLELLRELPEKIVQAAAPAALRVLETNFRQVEAEILAAMGRAPDPIQQAVDGIVSEHETEARAHDAERRRAVIAAGERVLAAAPPAIAGAERAP